MDQLTLADRAHAVILSTVGKTSEVNDRILREFTEFLPELAYVEEANYDIDEEQDPPVCSLLIAFTGGPIRMWSSKMALYKADEPAPTLEQIRG
jgi:hypothetical protein